MFSRDFLLGLRRRAIRRRAWFSLDSLDRGIFDLVTRVVDRVKSSVLGAVLVKIVKKMRDAMRSEFARRMEEYGLMKAREVSRQALRFGYEAADVWALDRGFVRYLTLVDVNSPPGWGV